VPGIPLEQKFQVLAQITRAQHFAWREAVRRVAPGTDPVEAVIEMWRVTGRDTARAYLPRLDPSLPLAGQVARSIAWSSQCMGEDAVAEDTAPGEATVRHTACPWFGWHARLGLSAEDRAGCDAWFAATVETINQALGTDLAFETLSTLPEGGDCCLRRFWQRTSGRAGEP
jgi:hypothetical protein